MSVSVVIHRLISRLADVLDYVQWRMSANETLSHEQLARVRHGEEQIARGEYVPLAEVIRLRGE